jgi:uncharacterized protein (TIRG00374 family)
MARRKAWHVGASVALVAAAFGFGLPLIADYGDTWARIHALSGEKIALLLAAGAWNLVTYWFVLMAALPGLTFGQAAVSSLSSTAVSNTVPAGGAWGVGVTWSMYRRWGFVSEDVTRSIAITGVLNGLVKLATPPVALAVVALEGTVTDVPWAVAGVSTVALTVAVALGAITLYRQRASTLAAGAIARIAGRFGGDGSPATWGTRIDGARDHTTALLAGRWSVLVASSVVSHASLFAVLLVAVRVVGVGPDVSFGEVLAAFAIVRVALMLPLTPGGAGLAELGLAGLLVAAGGPADDVVAAVLIFRATTWLLPVPLGFAAYLAWLRSHRDRLVGAAP